MMNLETFSPVIIVPIITGIAEAIKRAEINTKFIPFIALILGVLINISVSGLNPEAVILGLAYGLSSVGLFEANKQVGEIKREREGEDI